MTGAGARPFWTLVGVRVAFLVGTAITILWSGYHDRPSERRLSDPVFQAYNGHTDLLFNTFNHWDAGWYLHIAEHGYDAPEAPAFFPLYPLVVRGVGEVLQSLAVAGVLVSLVAAGIAAVVLARLGHRDSVLYLALFPVAFVFTAVYPEGLFLALAAGAFLAALRERPLVAAVLAALAVATRPMGLALLPALAIVLWSRERPWRLAPLAIVPVPIGLYAWYLDRELGDPFAFVEVQRTFWARETPTLGPLGGLWEATSTAWHGALQLLLHSPRAGETKWAELVASRNTVSFALLAAAIALTWVAWRRLGAAYGVYSAAYLTIVLSSPAEFVPLLSLPRFLLGDFPLFLALASLTQERPRARQIVLVAFAAVGGAAAVAFARHAWVT